MTGLVIGRYVSIFCRNCLSKPVVSDPAVWKRYIKIFLDLLQEETDYWLAKQRPKYYQDLCFTMLQETWTLTHSRLYQQLRFNPDGLLLGVGAGQ